MLAKRIIPCLDIKGGRVVKGVQFAGHRDAGDPVELAKRYNAEGADELVFYDITASADRRDTLVELVRRIAREIFIPFTVGGGIRTVEDMRAMLRAGADKISINTAALQRPDLINEGAAMFGSQCIVVGVDSMNIRGRDTVYSHTGRAETTNATGRDTREWIQEAQARGAGEIVLNAMNQDGMKQGYDLQLLSMVNHGLHIPLVASGGAGQLQDFVDVFTEGGADAALASSVFHFGDTSIKQVKIRMSASGIPVRSRYEST
jgi:imidazole glycerol-phosphate synthase subunit HisF